VNVLNKPALNYIYFDYADGVALAAERFAQKDLTTFKKLSNLNVCEMRENLYLVLALFFACKREGGRAKQRPVRRTPLEVSQYMSDISASDSYRNALAGVNSPPKESFGPDFASLVDPFSRKRERG